MFGRATIRLGIGPHSSFYQLVASSSAHLPLASQLHRPDGVVEVEFSGLKYVVIMDKRSEQKLYKSKREMILMVIILST